jgi:hypothetical protein
MGSAFLFCECENAAPFQGRGAKFQESARRLKPRGFRFDGRDMSGLM